MVARYKEECFVLLSLLLAAVLAGCSKGGDDSASTDDDVPVAYVKRSEATLGNPTDSIIFSAGGDLYIREKSSPSAQEIPVTESHTLRQGDVSDPEVSYDGTRILFAMRCTAQSAAVCTDPNNTGTPDTRWRIWEYNIANRSLRRIVCQTVDASNPLGIAGDDVDPAYLPDGGIVFTSSRQVGSWRRMQANGQTPYKILDEYEREEVTALHVMDADGANCQQISYNQSHDRNPTVMPNGQILFARWDHVGDRNHFSIFRTNPDGTDMFVQYGAHSPGNSFLHPRPMQDGRVMSSLMPLSGTDEGGALMIMDVANYTEHDTPMRRGLPQVGGQAQATSQTITLGGDLSIDGRITTPYPLWDGTSRALVSFAPCQVRRIERNVSQVIPCRMMTNSERAQLDDDERLLAEIQAANIQNDVPAAYSIWMLDYQTKQMRQVVPVESGKVITDPVALMPRDAGSWPNLRPRPLPSGNTGTVEVLSVYDTDHLGRMGVGSGGTLLLASETANVPLIAPRDANDTRPLVADLGRIKNPIQEADTSGTMTPNAFYLSRVARFIRVTTPMAPPSGSQGLRQAIGETEFEMQRILGYAQVEPDGSFMLNLPSDTPFAFAVLDAKGRAIQTHTNWMQLRPGERLACKGCHTPRPNFEPIADRVRGSHSTAQWMMGANGAETMAATRARVTGNASMSLSQNIAFSDVWANTAVIGAGAAAPDITFDYTTGTAPTGGSNAVGVPVPPIGGIINYPDHIQPIWDRARTGPCPGDDCRCMTCHTDPVRLSLSDTASGTGRLLSYEELLVGDPQLNNGQPVIVIRDGVQEVQRGPALISNSASQGEAGGIARKSRLMEILSGETMRSSSAAQAAHPTPAAPLHSLLLSSSELRLLAEWMDLGGQYYNTPFDNGIVRSVSGVSESAFTAANGIHSILMTRCAVCHQPGGSGTPPGTTFQGNRFVLTGSARGDFNATLALINNACAPGSSLLLSRPSTPHPATAASPTVVLPESDPDYTRIANWIQGGC